MSLPGRTMRKQGVQPLTNKARLSGSGGLGRLRSLSVNTRNAAERLPRFGRELWAPYLADTLLRVFASGGISGQLGNFTRPFLDFTQASVRLPNTHTSFSLYASMTHHNSILQRKHKFW